MTEKYSAEAKPNLKVSAERNVFKTSIIMVKQS